ncbi:MAG: PIN domain nuclease [Clostridia bacterium]|nr:PIN domain nuclease [Clostridia bacterium]
MLDRAFRAIFTLCGMLFGYGVSIFIINQDLTEKWGEKWAMTYSEQTLIVAAFVGTLGFCFFYFYSVLRKRGEILAKSIESDLLKIPANEMLPGVIGLLIGLVIAFLVSQIINGIEVLQTAYINTIISTLLYLFFGSLGMSISRKKSGEIGRVSWFASLAQKEQAAKTKGKARGAAPKILDTSVIIDGRIADIMKTGFIEGDIVIPEFVLVELRHIADSSDALKRNRGRRGLDILKKIQDDYGIEIYNTDTEKALEEIPEVDVKLLKLAQIMKGVVVTNDFNLNKVATLKGVSVLNINELANSVKPVVLPGEDMELFLVKEGKENNQGVAYLDDGTMIVVEDGKRYIGRSIQATVTSILQTSAGRMIFAKPNGS